jgi:membrane-associated protein
MSMPALAGYAALFAWIFLGESGLPLFLPAELMLVAAGVAAARGDASLTVVVLLAIGADFLGACGLFVLVRFARGRAVRLGHIERLIQRATDTAHALGARSTMRIALGRCVPFLRIPSAFGAALTDLPMMSFAPALLAGGSVWVSVFLGGGFILTEGALHI